MTESGWGQNLGVSWLLPKAPSSLSPGFPDALEFLPFGDATFPFSHPYKLAGPRFLPAAVCRCHLLFLQLLSIS